MKDGSLTVKNIVFEDNTAVKVSSNAKKYKIKSKMAHIRHYKI